MCRALWIKLVTLALAILAVVAVEGPLGWGIAAALASLGATTLLVFVFSVNSSFWAKTRWRSQHDTHAVSLTFDDGPDPTFTPRVLDILAEKQVSAAFFVVGTRARSHPELVASIHRAGHIVGNHSDRHDLSFHFKSRSAVRRELAACNAAIVSAIGHSPALFRSPQGFKNPALGDVLREESMTAIGWQVRGRDAMTCDADAVIRRITGGVEPGGVIQLHDGSGLGGTNDRTATLLALPVIVDRLRERGLRFVPLDQLLEMAAYRPASRTSRD